MRGHGGAALIGLRGSRELKATRPRRCDAQYRNASGLQRRHDQRQKTGRAISRDVDEKDEGNHGEGITPEPNSRYWVRLCGTERRVSQTPPLEATGLTVDPAGPGCPLQGPLRASSAPLTGGFVCRKRGTFWTPSYH